VISETSQIGGPPRRISIEKKVRNGDWGIIQLINNAVSHIYMVQIEAESMSVEDLLHAGLLLLSMCPRRSYVECGLS
jgi:hypothetical protein